MEDWLKEYEQQRQELMCEDARRARHMKALSLVENNFCLQELIACLEKGMVEDNNKWLVAIAEYVNKKYHATETDDSIWNVINNEVYEKQGENDCVHWAAHVSCEYKYKVLHNEVPEQKISRYAEFFLRESEGFTHDQL